MAIFTCAPNRPAWAGEEQWKAWNTLTTPVFQIWLPTAIRIWAHWSATGLPPPRTWYVDASASISGNGLSLASPLKNIQTAIDLALDGDTIRVAAGIYAPIDDTALNITIESLSGAARTIIDGGFTNRCATLWSPDSVLSGFTLRNGFTLENGGGAHGGILTQCTVFGNTATTFGGVCHVTLTNCIVWGNTSEIQSPFSLSESTAIASCLEERVGEGNIATNPRFVAPERALFRLMADSPCLAAGVQAPDLLEADADGRPLLSAEGIPAMGAWGASRNWYADSVAGDDENNGFSLSAAKKTLQAAIDGASDGDIVFASDGVYEPITTVRADFITRRITIESLNGAEVTVIDGDGTNRCATFSAEAVDEQSNAEVLIRGFTLRNGGGVEQGGGAFGGTLEDCVLTGNTAQFGGGVYGATLLNCLITGNEAQRGGGADEATLTRCTVSGNKATGAGGGVHNVILNYCTVSGNTAGIGGGVLRGVLTHSILFDNTATNFYGAASRAIMTNCTIVANRAENRDAIGLRNKLFNCIVWGNTEAGEPDDVVFFADPVIYSCLGSAHEGEGNIVADPLFVDAAAGDFRLKPESPCLGAGNPATPPSRDINGMPLMFNGRISMGALGLVASGAEGSYYVSPMGNDTANGLSWETAKKTIQAAIDAANDGDTIKVAAGIYEPINALRNDIGLWIFIEGVDGAERTIIDGGGTNRCATLSLEETVPLTWECDINTLMRGFTFRNGGCVEFGGGALGGRFEKCVFTANAAREGGGVFGATLSDCTLTGNSADCGGGADTATLTRCAISGNTARYYGGAIYYSTVAYCAISENTSTRAPVTGCVLTHSVIFDNTSTIRSGAVYDVVMTNCTVAVNRYEQNVNSTLYGDFVNCIFWGDTLAGGQDDIPHRARLSVMNYSSFGVARDGEGNIIGDPLFVDAAAGDFRLKPNSPCLGAGNPATPLSADINGMSLATNGRINMGAFGAVDATEFVSPTEAFVQSAPMPVLKAWLDANVPALVAAGGYDAAALAEPNGTPVWKSYVLGTDPNDPESRFKVNVTLENGKPVVTWEPDGVPGRVYTLQGKRQLTDSVWEPVKDTSGYRFFRVVVDLE